MGELVLYPWHNWIIYPCNKIIIPTFYDCTASAAVHVIYFSTIMMVTIG